MNESDCKSNSKLNPYNKNDVHVIQVVNLSVYADGTCRIKNLNCICFNTVDLLVFFQQTLQCLCIYFVDNSLVSMIDYSFFIRHGGSYEKKRQPF